MNRFPNEAPPLNHAVSAADWDEEFPEPVNNRPSLFDGGSFTSHQQKSSDITLLAPKIQSKQRKYSTHNAWGLMDNLRLKEIANQGEIKPSWALTKGNQNRNPNQGFHGSRPSQSLIDGLTSQQGSNKPPGHRARSSQDGGRASRASIGVVDALLAGPSAFVHSNNNNIHSNYSNTRTRKDSFTTNTFAGYNQDRTFVHFMGTKKGRRNSLIDTAMWRNDPEFWSMSKVAEHLRKASEFDKYHEKLDLIAQEATGAGGGIGGPGHTRTGSRMSQHSRVGSQSGIPPIGQPSAATATGAAAAAGAAPGHKSRGSLLTGSQAPLELGKAASKSGQHARRSSTMSQMSQISQTGITPSLSATGSKMAQGYSGRPGIGTQGIGRGMGTGRSRKEIQQYERITAPVHRDEWRAGTHVLVRGENSLQWHHGTITKIRRNDMGTEILDVLYYTFNGVVSIKSVTRTSSNVKAPTEDAWKLMEMERKEKTKMEKLFTGKATMSTNDLTNMLAGGEYDEQMMQFGIGGTGTAGGATGDIKDGDGKEENKDEDNDEEDDEENEKGGKKGKRGKKGKKGAKGKDKGKEKNNKKGKKNSKNEKKNGKNGKKGKKNNKDKDKDKEKEKGKRKKKDMSKRKGTVAAARKKMEENS